MSVSCHLTRLGVRRKDISCTALLGEKRGEGGRMLLKKKKEDVSRTNEGKQSQSFSARSCHSRSRCTPYGSSSRTGPCTMLLLAGRRYGG